MRKFFGPLFLIVLCPPAAMLMLYINAEMGGSLLILKRQIILHGIFFVLHQAWAPYFWGSPLAWKMLASYAAFQLLLMKALPGKATLGPISPKGNIPIYKANGLVAFFTTLSVYGLASFGLKLFSPTIIYDNLGALIGALNLFSLPFCLFLYLKGRYFPSSSDQGTSGNFLFDFYWGTELYPRVFGWDIKMFTNCRVGMMGWALIAISCAAKQTQLYGLSDSMLVALLLQLYYIGKFFFWEMGYMRSLDIMHDRAGFYICWGCLVWIGSVYTSPIQYLIHHPNHLGLLTSTLIFLLGFTAISINLLADRQRQRIRQEAGTCKIWLKPPNITLAKYTTGMGEEKETLLLASGWWGIARHFHYVPELLGALFWSLPALFSNFLPYFYFFFLTILLVDRAFRDDKRCRKKYGIYWKEHCEKVPYKILPYII